MNRFIPLLMLVAFLSVACNNSKESPGISASFNDTSAPPPVAETTTVPAPEPILHPPELEPEPPPEVSETEPVPTPPQTIPTVPALALSFQTNVTLFDFSSTEEDKYNQAVALVKKVVATEKFRNLILNYNYNGTGKFSTTSMTNAQVYQAVLDAAEKLRPIKNNTMDIGVKLYYENNTVVGYTSPSYSHINVNTKYFQRYEINEVAGNLFHEWLHKLGFGHDAEVTPRRPYSVPYGIGYMIRDIGKSFL